MTVISGDSATGRTEGGEVAPAEGPGGWPAVRDDSDIQWYPSVREDPEIQFEPLTVPEREPADNWLVDFFRWLGELMEPLARFFGSSWPVIKWVLLAMAVAALLYLLFRLIAPAMQWRPKKKAEVEEEEWAPDREEAIALLDDADRLAQEGRYGEATHLLLKRSVKQISDARPDWVEPSSTARELAALPALPDAARTAFRVIAERVERSLFALRKLGHDDWQAARDAYAEFALARF